MKVVFVIPPFDYAWSIGSPYRRARNGILPPLGVGFLAAALEARGHEAALVDAMAERFNIDQTAEAVAALNPGLIGLSVMTCLNAPAALETARALRRRCPGVPLVAGGPHVTGRGPAFLEDCPDADYAVPGDGEIPLCALADALTAGTPLEDCPGLWLRDAERVPTSTAAAPFVKDLDSFAPPARRLYKPGLYQPLPSLNLGRHVTTVITARGCPWARCAFCHQGNSGAARFRRRSPEHVVTEIEDLVRNHGMRSIVFWDDNFCVMSGWIRSFCDLLDSRKIRIKWSVLARADTVTPEMLRRVAASGCHSIQFGFESGVPELLTLINKGTTLDQYRDAVRWSREAGLEVRGSFMLGFPTETPEMSEETIRFACELNADYMLFFAYHVLPGTPLEAFAREHGRTGPTGDFNIHMPSYVPDTYPDADTLARMVRRAYARYYLRPAYVARAAARLLRAPSLAGNHARGLLYWAGLLAAGTGSDPRAEKPPRGKG
jgi:radical SAM superfamily enzyme YgiQ (UPF0313 family)